MTAKEKPPRSDLAAVPTPLNRLLDALMRCEAALGPLPVPAGLSVMAAARKVAIPTGEEAHDEGRAGRGADR